MSKQKMIVLTGLFFNNKGNQSFFNSIRNYTSDYDVSVITAASMASDVYLSINEVKQKLPEVEIFPVMPRVFEFARRARNAQIKNRADSGSSFTENRELINTGSGGLTYYAFLFRSLLLAILGCWFLYKNRNGNPIICAYEINGLFALSIIKRFFPKAVSFAKFQGTVLGFDIARIKNKEVQLKYRLDYAALQKINCIDGAIMTNDGTNGLNVLLSFGMEERNILFIQNGIDERYMRADIPGICKTKDARKIIKSVSVSRLTKWKRVDLIIRSFAKLVHICGRGNFSHTIVGMGSPSEEMEIVSLIQELKLSDCVFYYGSADTERVRAIMLESDLLISVYKYSNVANPVLEALALSLPVLTIFQSDLRLAIGELVGGCFFVDDSDDELNLVDNLADKLCSINIEKIEEKKILITSLRDTLLTWEERGDREIEFIKSLRK